MYEWFHAWVEGNPLTVLTFAQNLPVEILMAHYDPVGPLTSQTIHEAEGAAHPAILVDRLNDGWLVAIERRSYVGSDTDWLNELSLKCEVVNLAHLEASLWVGRASAGQLIAGIDLVVPETRYGADPGWLDPYLADVEPLMAGMFVEVEPFEQGPDHSLPAAAARILERGCGIHLSESMLTKSLPSREIRDPDAPQRPSTGPGLVDPSNFFAPTPVRPLGELK